MLGGIKTSTALASKWKVPRGPTLVGLFFLYKAKTCHLLLEMTGLSPSHSNMPIWISCHHSKRSIGVSKESGEDSVRGGSGWFNFKRVGICFIVSVVFVVVLYYWQQNKTAFCRGQKAVCSCGLKRTIPFSISGARTNSLLSKWECSNT